MSDLSTIASASMSAAPMTMNTDVEAAVIKEQQESQRQYDQQVQVVQEVASGFDQSA